ncbi:Predicted hydrolase of the alpha/beta superfamily [Alteromonadaceae bacterium Bs31]|nr:Predicted hydrolase of the alpha/beta superfamily [Alteromonadaceae bacterium Bs31]
MNSPSITCWPVLLFSVIILASCSGDDSGGKGAEIASGPATPLGSQGISQASPVDPRADTSKSYDWMGRGEIEQSISSSITGVSYKYHVYLPPEYDLEIDREFPIIYILDAQWGVEFQMRVVDLEARPVIIVGIEEGPSGRRATDYILPGGRVYFDFFTQEFIPRVESEYRVLAADRTFEGTSAGGAASLIMMLLDTESPPIFKNHFSFDPYVQSSLYELMDERYASGMPLDKTLYLTAATGRDGLHLGANAFVQSLKNKKFEGLSISSATYDVSHYDVTWASFSHALEIVFGESTLAPLP